MNNSNMGMECSINQRDESAIYKILNTKINGRDHFGNLCAEGGIILY
jgi:hypothetical protein